MKQEILKKIDNASEKINVEDKCQFNKHTDNDGCCRSTETLLENERLLG